MEFKIPKSFAGNNELEKDFKIIEKTKNMIKYTFIDDMPVLYDDRLLDHVYINDNFFSANGAVCMILPSYDKSKTIKSKYTCNKQMFISSIGKIDNNIINTTLNNVINQLYIITDTYIQKNNIIITYDKFSYFFIDKTLILKTIEKFMKICYKFFDIHENFVWVINYFGKLQKNNTGYGGNYNFSGFNYFVLWDIKVISKEQQNNILIILCHELFHHFNKNGKEFNTNWFGEGFTEFFTRYLLLNKKDFDRACNSFIKQYYINIYREKSVNFIMKEGFWNNVFVEKLPYVKGFMYALHLLQIYKSTFIERYIKLIRYIHKNKLQGNKINNKLIISMLKLNDFNKYMLKDNIIEIQATKNIKLKDTKIKFDLDEAVLHNKIGGLDKNSYTASQGLINGKIENIKINYSQRTIKIEQNNKTILLKTDIGNTIDIPQI